MMRRLQDIFKKMYKPPTDGTRQVFALSRADAERLPQLPSMAVISITAPERPPANLGCFVHVLRLSFDDVDFLSPNLSVRAQGKLVHAFTIEQAQAIRRFVESLPSDVTTVAVHCEGCHSRSCAVALALHRLYGYHVALGRLTDANPSVVSVLMGDVRPQRKARRGQV